MTRSAEAAAREAVAQVFRDERVTLLATLIRQVGDFQVAEDAVQEAFATALHTWPRDGVPASPAAWLTTAARRKAIDRLRRDRTQLANAAALQRLVEIDRRVRESGGSSRARGRAR